MPMWGEIFSNEQLNFRAKSQQSLANIIDEISDFLFWSKCLMADEAEFVHRYVERTERRDETRGTETLRNLRQRIKTFPFRLIFST